MAACWTQTPRLEPGDEPHPSDSPDPCLAVLPDSDGWQVLEKLRISRVILRADISELANTTVRALQSSTPNISMLMDLYREVEQKQDQLRKLDGLIHNLLDFDTFVKDLEEADEYLYTVSRTKVLLRERISQATLRTSFTVMKTLSPPQLTQDPLRGGYLPKQDAASALLSCAARVAFETISSSSSMEERIDQHSDPTFRTSSMSQAAGCTSTTEFDQADGSVASRRSQDNTTPYSDALGAKTKKPSRMGNTQMKTIDEWPSSDIGCNYSKAFTRAPQVPNGWLGSKSQNTQIQASESEAFVRLLEARKSRAITTIQTQVRKTQPRLRTKHRNRTEKGRGTTRQKIQAASRIRIINARTRIDTNASFVTQSDSRQTACPVLSKKVARRRHRASKHRWRLKQKETATGRHLRNHIRLPIGQLD